jgi:hypothetical protein
MEPTQIAPIERATLCLWSEGGYKIQSSNRFVLNERSVDNVQNYDSYFNKPSNSVCILSFGCLCPFQNLFPPPFVCRVDWTESTITEATAGLFYQPRMTMYDEWGEFELSIYRMWSRHQRRCPEWGKLRNKKFLHVLSIISVYIYIYIYT